MLKRITSTLLLIAAILSLTASLASCSKKSTYYVKLEIRDYGDIILELDRDNAPITVDNFVSLVKSGFYDGLTFHRVIEGFMIQGGDPNGNGTGDSGKEIKGEFSSNGHNNKISHTRGVISMARGNDYDSASCQFFIVHADSLYLDGKYAAFGYVIEGMDVVDAIVAGTVKYTYGGVIYYKQYQPVIERATVLDNYKK